MRKYNGHATAGELEGAHQKSVHITQKNEKQPTEDRERSALRRAYQRIGGTLLLCMLYIPTKNINVGRGTHYIPPSSRELSPSIVHAIFFFFFQASLLKSASMVAPASTHTHHARSLQPSIKSTLYKTRLYS